MSEPAVCPEITCPVITHTADRCPCCGMPAWFGEQPAPPFTVGQRVEKTSGYPFTGPVVACFLTRKGEWRVVVDREGTGLLHIFAPHQLSVMDGGQR